MDASRTVTRETLTRELESRELEETPMWAGTRAVDAAPALAAALAGERSLLPVPADDPARARLLARTQRAGEPVAADVAVVACTSGSTGTPKGALLTAANLRASIDATHARLGGPGQWLLTTPPSHIAGLQVLLRTIRAGEEPAAMDLDGGFRPAAFADSVGRMTGRRRYTSVVPAQLRRILADPAAAEAMASLDAVLVGGQATPPDLLRRAGEAGITAVTTYGSSETSGGAAYDGIPLSGAEFTVADPAPDGTGRIVISGPMVARGYRNADSADLRPGPGGGVFRTSDAGRVEATADGPRVTVLGRMDDVIVSGGLKFLPGPVEEALASLPEVAEAAVVGVPHAEFGQAVVAAVVLSDAHRTDDAAAGRDAGDRIRARVAPLLAKHQAPRKVAVVTHLPTLPSGKLDRRGLAGTLAARWGMMAE